MSNRYINKSIKKDIYSNSSGRAAIKYIDDSNLNLLNIDSNNGLIETKNEYSGDLNGFLLSIPSFTMTENVYCKNQEVSSSVFILWSKPSETITYDNGNTNYFFNVKYVTSATRPNISNNFILWNTTSNGLFTLVMPTNQVGNYAILSVEESTSGTTATVPINAYYTGSSNSNPANNVYLIDNFNACFRSYFNSNELNFTTSAEDDEEVNGPLQEIIYNNFGNESLYIDLETNELRQFSNTKLYIDYVAQLTVGSTASGPPDYYETYDLCVTDVLNGTTLKLGTKYLDIVRMYKGQTRLQGSSAPKLIYDTDGWINNGLLKLVKMAEYERYFYVPI